MNFYVNHIQDPDGDIWKLEQDRKRMSDQCAPYNLGLAFVDRTTGQPIQLHFDVDWQPPGEDLNVPMEREIRRLDPLV